jgi:anti-sigma regulatory factor (Ser/Thr protein kinase)
VFQRRPVEVGQARRFLAQIVSGWPCADDAITCVSELASNAVLHSDSRKPGGWFSVRVAVAAWTLRVEVADPGGLWEDHDRDEESGRGLALVAGLARTWGRTGGRRPGGRVVWFEMDFR